MLKTLFGRPIRFRNKLLIVFNLSILIPMIVFGSVMFGVTQKRLLSDNSRLYGQTAEQINTVFFEYVSQIDKIDQGIATTDAVPEYLKYTSGYVETDKQKIHETREAAYSYLQELSRINSDVYSISVVTLDGTIITCGNGIYRNNDFDIDNEYYSDLLDSSGNIVILPLRRTDYTFQTPEDVFCIARRYVDFSTDTHSGLLTYTGYIIVECSLSKFDSICHDINFGKNSAIIILDNSKNIAYSTSDDGEFDQLAAEQFASGDDTNDSFSFNGTKYLLIDNLSPDTGWTVIGAVPRNIFYAGSDNIRLTFLLLCGFCVLAVFTASVYISGNITRPIRDLQNAMREVEQGNFGAVAPVCNKNDELGELSESFNNLIQQMKTLLDNISASRQRESEARYKLAISQINPHFLYNTLDSIRMMAVIDGNKEIESSLENLSAFFRYLVRQRESFVTLSEELDQTKHYIFLQKIRYDDRFDPLYRVDTELLSCYIPKIILQPLTENAILHGITNAEHPCILVISVRARNGRMYIHIADNGVGMPKQTLRSLQERLRNRSDSDSIGLANINERLCFYFGKKSRLRIRSRQGQGTVVSFEIPLILQKPDSLLPYYKEEHNERKP